MECRVSNLKSDVRLDQRHSTRKKKLIRDVRFPTFFTLRYSRVTFSVSPFVSVPLVSLCDTAADATPDAVGHRNVLGAPLRWWTARQPSCGDGQQLILVYGGLIALLVTCNERVSWRVGRYHNDALKEYDVQGIAV